MAYMMEGTIDPKWQVAFNWDDPDAWLSRMDNTGEPKLMRKEQVPPRATFNTKRAALPDFCLVQAWINVSQRVRDRIASLEPDRNQYFPFEVARKNGQPVLGPDGEPLRTPYYLINTTTRFDAIMIEESGIDPASIKFGLVHPYRDKLGTIVLDRRLTAGHHVWEGIRHFAGRIMISDELGDWIIANKMKGNVLTRLREG
jgi:hypothetical protein